MSDYGRPIRFGYFLTPAAHPTRPLALARLADELGLDYLGVQDHPYQRRFHDTWMLMAAIAMRTQRISILPDVACLPLRPPAMMAKAAASLDQLSGGRFELGLGAGGFWDAIVAMGGPRRTPGESITALEEAVQVLRLMWSEQSAARFQGEFYELAGVRPGPPPAHPIEIWLGVYKPRGLAQLSDETELGDVVDRVVSENPQAVADYRAGKKQAVGALLGKVSAATGRRADMKLAARLIEERLSR